MIAKRLGRLGVYNQAPACRIGCGTHAGAPLHMLKDRGTIETIVRGQLAAAAAALI